MAEAPRQVLRVAPGTVVHHGPASAPFRAGDRIDLPPDHAEQLVTGGHVLPEAEGASPPPDGLPARGVEHR